jgi:hypothetical protein
MDWTPILTALIALAGVALGLVVAAVQRHGDWLEAARIREEDRQARREEWIRDRKLPSYSALFVILRSLPSPDALKSMVSSEMMARLESSTLEVDKYLSSLVILVDASTADEGIQVQIAARQYYEAVRRASETFPEMNEDIRQELDNLYNNYESWWSSLAGAMRRELGIESPPVETPSPSGNGKPRRERSGSLGSPDPEG